ncbi:hypothetical protein [Paraburkholderia sediminicola]|uniref:hypothetical protein n=1 Tax=Paraburkholderia sediminicola TaxID=458836 RepID=UPI0038BB13F4
MERVSKPARPGSKTRSDSLSDDVDSLTEQEDFKVRYATPLDHCGTRGTRNNASRYLKEAVDRRDEFAPRRALFFKMMVEMPPVEMYDELLH